MTDSLVSVTNTTASISTININSCSIATTTTISSVSSICSVLPKLSSKITSPIHESPSSSSPIPLPVPLSVSVPSPSQNFQENISKYDISTFYERSLNLSEIEKHDLIKNVSDVDPKFSFPETGLKKKRFLFSWLKQFPWLR